MLLADVGAAIPANLTPDYLAAERAYPGRPTLPFPKRKLSQAHPEFQEKGGAYATPFYLLEKEGAGQVVRVGAPNAGKSQPVPTLTHARDSAGSAFHRSEIRGLRFKRWAS